ATPHGISYPGRSRAEEVVMRKRYTRKYRVWSPRFKWKVKDFARLVEFEREWKGQRRSKT
ncbi:MAG TPA: hypothetical protein VEM93_09050, partial [Actinomycetota bacterium]|nr:hypothetical protein [Actinomycetota bacterium]